MESFGKNKASINPGGCFVAIKYLLSSKAAQMHSGPDLFSLYIVFHKIKFYQKKKGKRKRQTSPGYST